MKLTLSCPLERDRGREEEMAEVHTVQGSRKQLSYLPLPCPIPSPSPHPPPPPPAWHWTTREIEGGGMGL